MNKTEISKAKKNIEKEINDIDKQFLVLKNNKRKLEDKIEQLIKETQIKCPGCKATHKLKTWTMVHYVRYCPIDEDYVSSRRELVCDKCQYTTTPFYLKLSDEVVQHIKIKMEDYYK